MSERGRIAQLRHELYADLLAQIEKALVEEGIGAFEAHAAAAAAVDRVADYWGGQSISFPKDTRRRLTVRELAVYDRWSTGAHLSDLAREFDATDRTIRRMLDRIRRKLRSAAADGQMDLLGGELQR